ncbi:MAG: phage virion morphogenesis protein [bacterium]|nr:phage virion morphogenesis protein [bacterium]
MNTATLSESTNNDIMPFKLHLHIEYPDEKPLKRVMLVYQRVENLQPAFERILPLLQHYTENYLAREGRYEGNPPFAPLSPRYARYKAKRYPGAPILTRSGRLRASLASITSDSIADASPDALVYGTRTPYALYHQYGTRKMPKRPPLKLSKTLSTRIITILRNYLLEQGEKQGENL